MRLVECAAPASAVSSAPLTALRDSHSVTVPTVSQMADGRLVAGFWGLEDDAYYVRERNGSVDAWFCLIDDEPASEPVGETRPVRARVLPLRARGHSAMRVTFRQDRDSARTLIVGVSPARARGR
jgi:hypothetical protein